MSETTPQHKARLRTQLLAVRSWLSADARSQAATAITAHGLAQWRSATSVAAYVSIGAEPGTHHLLDGLAQAGVEVILPVIGDGGLDWAPYSPDELVAGPLGIRQPAGPRLGPGALDRMDVIIVPALAVDPAGNRLGRGRGYYDRALAAVSAPIVAVVYDAELLDAVPVAPHDRRVDAVLRPAGITSSG